MNISALDQIKSFEPASKPTSPEDVRDMAMKFEALLLNQLTSIMNRSTFDSSEDGEESLFGNDGGTSLAKQLFSEQLAMTMAQAGGMGLADVLMRQFGVEPLKANAAGASGGLSDAASVLKSIKNEAQPMINRTGKAVPIERLEFKGDPNDAEVISTFEDQARSEGVEESLRNLVLDGRIVNTTRPRTAPNSPINDITPISGIESKASTSLSYQFPVAGRLSSDFGNRVHPIDRKVKFHAGLDLAVPRGTSVEASAEGTVSFAGWSGGYGNLVVIKHVDGRETRYAHMDRLTVAEGDKVLAGEQIGLSGSTGKSTGPHLHFEIREKGQVLDPQSILTKGLR